MSTVATTATRPDAGAGAGSSRAPYVGRFAPSPTGVLHAGSLVAALASWLDARSQDGRWLLRIEDLDTPRNVAGAAAAIVDQLERCGLRADGAVLLQSTRIPLYRQALDRLLAAGDAYPCGCSRSELRALAGSVAAGGERAYPGTCRNGLGGRPARSYRLRTAPSAADATACPDAARCSAPITWNDRRLGAQSQDVARAVGDFILKRADGIWAYQLAVVVDDAAQGITDVVRGEDLADNTARQILLQRRLGLPTPRHLHVPLVHAADGQKLSKQTGAEPLALRDPLAALQAAGRVLGIEAGGTTVADWLAAAVRQWRAVYPADAAAPVAGIIRD